MKRIVVKAKLLDKTEFITTLSDINMDFSAPYWQHDRIFTPKGFTRNKNLPRLSLRTIIKDQEKPAIYALVLRRHIANKGIDVVNYTTIKDYTETAHILHQLGFELKYEIGRERQELTMGEGLKVYLDRIDDLPGYYAKIESNITNDTEAKESREDLIQTFQVLKVPRTQITDHTFGELLKKHKN